MSVTTVTELVQGGLGPNSNFVNQYKVYRSDGSLFTDSTGGLTSGLLVLSVANGNALTNFEPPIGNDPSPPYACLPGTGPGWTPQPLSVAVRGYTSDLAFDGSTPLTPAAGSVLLIDDSFVRDTDDTTGQSVKCKLQMTSAAFQYIIIEVPV